MVHRVNLTVPDRLWERIQKGRDGLNLSKIFQDAVTARLDRRDKTVIYTTVPRNTRENSRPGAAQQPGIRRAGADNPEEKRAFLLTTSRFSDMPPAGPGG